MKVLIRFCLLSLLFIFFRCDSEDKIPLNLKKEYPEALTISAKNGLSLSREDAAVMLDVIKIKEKSPVFNEKAFVVWCDKEELPSEAIDSDGDGRLDRIIIISDFKPKEQKMIRLLYIQIGEKIREYPKRTQAELSHKVGGQFVNRKYQGGTFQNVQFLRVPPEHTDHSSFIRYEGPGWESDKVGYRFYLDWRNAIDIFGKKVPDMILQDVGQDGFDSYHEMADWGLDIFKVGNSFGLGSIGMWYKKKGCRVEKTDSISCSILENGVIYSQIRTQYYGWKVGPCKVNLTSDLSIAAGSRLTLHHLHIEGEVDNICTGLAKHTETILLLKEPQNTGEWGYMAQWGKQSLAGEDDELGIAVLYKKSQFVQIAEDDLNHVIILQPQNNHIHYYLLAAWDQEPEGIQTREEFEEYLNQTISFLNTPIEVTY